MTTTYTNINKPTGTTYSNQNSMGKEQYDQASIMYDDPGVFYDGVNQSAYTSILKPSGGTVTILSGMATGLIMPPTYAENIVVGVDPYTYISKPN